MNVGAALDGIDMSKNKSQRRRRRLPAPVDVKSGGGRLLVV
jgi:hypothetical protein